MGKLHFACYNESKIKKIKTKPKNNSHHCAHSKECFRQRRFSIKTSCKLRKDYKNLSFSAFFVDFYLVCRRKNVLDK